MAITTLGMSKTYNIYSIPKRAAVQSSIAFEKSRNSRKNHWLSLFEQLMNDRSYHGVSSGHSFAITYSSTSIHWLSKKPCNISNHCYINLNNRLDTRQAYLDYSNFSQHRSRELVSGGVLILNNLANDDQDKPGNEPLLNLLYKRAQLLPLTSQELLDFTMPFFFRSCQQWLDEDLFTQHSLQVIKRKSVLIESSICKQWKDGQITLDKYAHSTSSFVRGRGQPILEQTFVNNHRKPDEIPTLLTQYWTLYEEQLEMGVFSIHHV